MDIQLKLHFITVQLFNSLPTHFLHPEAIRPKTGGCVARRDGIARRWSEASPRFLGAEAVLHALSTPLVGGIGGAQSFLVEKWELIIFGFK